jgi:UDP-3-O-[3-hydroxymyristoyl] glucosamine N-acyltransferase
MKLREMASKLGCVLQAPGGDGAAGEGAGEREMHGVAGLETAGPDEITFLANSKYAPKVRETKAGAIIVDQEFFQHLKGEAPLPCLISANPYLAFARAVGLFYQAPRPAAGIHPTAVIAADATIGEKAAIGAYVVVGPRVKIGRSAVLHPHVTIYEGAEIGDDFVAHSQASVREHCRIGDRVILQTGVVVGGDGFGFAKRADGSHEKIPQSGPTIVEDDVEIQSLSNVDRASVGETRIRRGAKIDSLVQVGHACEVGEDNIICSQAGLAGSTILKKNVLLAGQAGISGHLTIHEGAIVYAQGGIGGDVAAGTVVAGSPAFDAATWRRAVTAFPKLPEMLRQLRHLERRVAELEAARPQSKETKESQ